MENNSIQAFIKAIETEQFVQAHELLEHDWKAYKKAGLKQEAKALQGLINGATALALYHIKKREEAYERVWKVFIKYQPLLEEITIANKEDYLLASELLMQKNKSLVKK